MPLNDDNINVAQLKEFFELKASHHEEKIEKLENNINRFMDKYGDLVDRLDVKVGMVLKVGSGAATILAAAIGKALGYY